MASQVNPIARTVVAAAVAGGSENSDVGIYLVGWAIITAALVVISDYHTGLALSLAFLIMLAVITRALLGKGLEN